MKYLHYIPGNLPLCGLPTPRKRTIVRCFADFERALVLEIGRLSNADQFVVVVPASEPQLARLARNLAAEAPNVDICAHEDAAFMNGERGPDGRFDITRAVVAGLKNRDWLWTPDEEFELPAAQEISLENDLGLTAAKLERLKSDIREWKFDTHVYTRDELVGCLFVIFSELQSAPGIDASLKLSDKDLLWFLLICRSYYRSHIYYHTFYHCVDVVQAQYLIHTTLNPWKLPATDILAQVLAALGHDLLHPGLTSALLRQCLPEFASRFSSLETYHAHVFSVVLEKLWSAAARAVNDTVRQSIVATELDKHALYLQSPSAVHSIKFADLANVARPDPTGSQRSAIDIFLEMRAQHIVSDMLGLKLSMVVADPTLPATQVLVGLQVMFLTKIACPYFEWLAQQLPEFRQFSDTANNSLRSWYAMQQSGNFNLVIPFSPPATRSCHTPGIPVNAIP